MYVVCEAWIFIDNYNPKTMLRVLRDYGLDKWVSHQTVSKHGSLFEVFFYHTCDPLKKFTLILESGDIQLVLMDDGRPTDIRPEGPSKYVDLDLKSVLEE